MLVFGLEMSVLRAVLLFVGITHRKKIQGGGVFSTDVCTVIVFFVLVLLLILNVILYYKLWSLEEAPSYTILDLHILK